MARELGKAAFCLVAAGLAAWLGFAVWFTISMASFDGGEPDPIHLLLLVLLISYGLLAIYGTTFFVVRVVKTQREPSIASRSA